MVFDNKQQHDDDSVYLTIYSYDSFLMRVIEITRTLILLFIMLHVVDLLQLAYWGLPTRPLSQQFLNFFLIMNCA